VQTNSSAADGKAVQFGQITSWIIDAPDLNGLLAYAKTQPGGTALLTGMLDQPSTYVMTESTDGPIPAALGSETIPAGWDVTPAIMTPDLVGVQQAATNHEAAIFDLETPCNNYPDGCTEQDNPGPTFVKARAIMGSGTLIAVPGDNLAIAVDPSEYDQNTRYDGIVNLNLAGSIAPSADDYAIQAQGLQYDTRTDYTYPSFVSKVSGQAKAAHPSIGIYSVLISLNSGGTYMTPQDMYAAASSVSNQVKGFWLGVSILPYPWTDRTPPNYCIPYSFLKMWANGASGNETCSS
jgi:hypothetical protein